MEFLTQEVIGQAVGLLGTATMCLSYQCKQSKRVFFVQLLACFMFCAHFLLLGAYTGLILNGLEIIRAYLLYREDKKWTNHWAVILGVTIIMTAGGVFTWEGWYSLFPILAAAVSTPILWTRDAKKLRYAGLFLVSPCWLVYNCVVFSIAGILTETLNIGSILISLIRYKGFREPD